MNELSLTALALVRTTHNAAQKEGGEPSVLHALPEQVKNKLESYSYFLAFLSLQCTPQIASLPAANSMLTKALSSELW